MEISDIKTDVLFPDDFVSRDMFKAGLPLAKMRVGDCFDIHPGKFSKMAGFERWVTDYILPYNVQMINHIYPKPYQRVFVPRTIMKDVGVIFKRRAVDYIRVWRVA